MNARQRRQARRTPEAVAWRALTKAAEAGYFADTSGEPNTTITDDVVLQRARDLVGRKDVRVECNWEFNGKGFFRFWVGGYRGRDVRG